MTQLFPCLEYMLPGEFLVIIIFEVLCLWYNVCDSVLLNLIPITTHKLIAELYLMFEYSNLKL